MGEGVGMCMGQAPRCPLTAHPCTHPHPSRSQNSQCPFILKCFDSFEDQGSWWLVLENCAAGDLFAVINDTGAVQEEGWMVTQVLLPLLQTLVYLHHEGLIHRDIKPGACRLCRRVCMLAIETSTALSSAAPRSSPPLL